MGEAVSFAIAQRVLDRTPENARFSQTRQGIHARLLETHGGQVLQGAQGLLQGSKALQTLSSRSKPCSGSQLNQMRGQKIRGVKRSLYAEIS